MTPKPPHHGDPDYRMLLLQLCASLTLAEHMGDAAEDVEKVLKDIGIVIKDDSGEFWPALQKKLARMGVTTVWGTSIGDDDDG